MENVVTNQNHIRFSLFLSSDVIPISLLINFRNAVTSLQSKLLQWKEYESLRDQCLSWLRDTDTFIHSVDLKATCDEKQQQSEQLKVIEFI